MEKRVERLAGPLVIRKRWVLVGSGGLLAFVVAYALLVAFLQTPSRVLVLDLMNVVPPLATALICGLAALKARSARMSIFWGLIAFAHLFAAMAEATWAWYELVLRIETPYPSYADIYWLAFYPLAFGGLIMLALVRVRKRILGVAAGLDALLFAAAMAGLGWELMVRPAVEPAAGFLVNVTNIAYPAGDILLLVGLASLVVGPARGRSPRGLVWLASAFVVTLLVDSLFAQMVAAGTYGSTSWIDPLWPLGYTLAAMSAFVYLGGTRREAPSTADSAIDSSDLSPKPSINEIVRRFMPYVAVASVAFLAYYHFLVTGGGSLWEDAVIVGIIIVVPALVLLRQLVVVVENRRLQASLAQLTRDLETRVVERTGQLNAEKTRLALLNEVAKKMSSCVTSADVLKVSAQLVVKAVPCDAAAISITASRGHSCLVVGKRLSKPGRHQLERVIRSLPISQNGSPDRPLIRIEGPELCGPSNSRPTQRPLTSVTVVPLVSQRTTLGALCLAYENSASALSPEQQVLLEGISSQIAIALQSARRYDEARFLSERDPVTGLLNHRGIGKHLDREISRSGRAGSRLALVMMDLDNFKLFNDAYGHVVGDQVLAWTAQILMGASRAADVVGRFGGDEFLALLPDTDETGATAVVERIRRYLADQPFEVPHGPAVPLCLSYGVSVFPLQGRQPSELLAIADANLYLSKQRGGDCVTFPGYVDDHREAPGGVFTVLDGLVNTVDNKDHYTRRHSDDVTERALALATGLGLSSETQRSLRIAGLLHDVGKIGIPDRVLRKPGPLTEEEYEAIKQHVGLGELIIKEIPNLHEVLAAVSSHHERWDGEGYPRGLKGEEIPLLGRILAVTDAYSAMTTDRPYRKALTVDQAKAELRRVAGTQLDPKIVEVFISVLDNNICDAFESTSDAAVA